MIESVLSCHFQLSLPLFRAGSVFLLSHLSPPCCRVHLSSNVSQFPLFNFLDSFFSSISGFPSRLLSSSFPLSFLLSVLFWLLCFSLVFVILWLHLISGERQRRLSSAQRDALRGFSLWKPSNLNADGNIFRGFYSTMSNIPNKISGHI